MCGIFGSFSFEENCSNPELIKKISQTLQHRGPDNFGYYSDKTAVLANLRLSILDLTSKSNQPMFSDDKNIIVVQNGEIYNFIELREELIREGFKFKTSGDTEVVVKAFEKWGPNFVSKLNGMFAIAIYCINSQTLYIFRDRLGVKPLFFSISKSDKTFWFASEIKAILKTGKSFKPNLDSIAQYLALNYIPSPYTAFQDIYHLEPGHFLEISKDKGMQTKRYWNLLSKGVVSDMTVSEATSGLITLLDDATRIRMRSDARFGAFLSGGLDSSSVVGLMSLYSSEPIKTFSVGFDDPRFDETQYAIMAAKRFGTQHHTVKMNVSSRQQWLNYIWHCDQPHGDVSFIPMGEISKRASQDVKMVLTGDGGDELFGGYKKYIDYFDPKKSRASNNDWIRDYVISTGLFNELEGKKLFHGSLKEIFLQDNPYRTLENSIKSASNHDDLNRVLYADTLNLLPGNNLVKPDRMAMAHSLEVRSPFLDYRLVEFSFSIPGKYKINNGETKWIYKQAIEPMLGDELTYRKKQMFTVPVGEWFKTTLKSFCKEILLDGRLENRQIINVSYLKEMVESHLKGSKNYTREIRGIISLEIWYRLFVDEDPDWLGKINKTEVFDEEKC